ncbi:TspO/MBR family protein [Pannonibacter phragmitetus]|uniref:TspO/MBR family protein n=1 Tax=Pannonibacter phragmitetus TaxID=121719 RepID=UPI003D2ECEF8
MTRKPSLPLLALFLLISVGGGLLIGATNLPGEWYAGLAKPSFTPPNWLFGPAWTVLYILIGIAGWRSFSAGAHSTLFRLWVLQMLLNFAWSPTVFTWHRLDAGLGIILALLAAILAFIAAGWRRDRLAALLFVPYAAWVSFATALNLALVQLN